jgi:hypothetical protein
LFSHVKTNAHYNALWAIKRFPKASFLKTTLRQKKPFLAKKALNCFFIGFAAGF